MWTAASASVALNYSVPDPRNRRHQFYCSGSGCRAASKAASQTRWRAKPENQSYFRGPVNVARVQAWRARHLWLLAQGARYQRCVTGCLSSATHWFRSRNSQCGGGRRYKNSCRRNLLF